MVWNQIHASIVIQCNVHAQCYLRNMQIEMSETEPTYSTKVAIIMWSQQIPNNKTSQQTRTMGTFNGTYCPRPLRATGIRDTLYLGDDDPPSRDHVH